MKLVMAVSRDGFVSRRPTDDMSWLGPFDKAAFRIITGVGGNVATSRRTARLMPSVLQGRKLHTLSREGGPGTGLTGRTGTTAWGSLRQFQGLFGEGGWLIGGLTLALAAAESRWLSEIHLCRSDRMCWEGTPFGKDLLSLSRLTYRMKTRVGDTTVEVYR